MTMLETGTSTGNTLGAEYQVFLSFRGPDTRYGFTRILYNALVDVGIRVFIDDEELCPGEKIRGNLLQAINDSKLYIPIFSPTYASSHWCLHELAKMVENTFKSKDGDKRVILPIFYKVKPDDVKLKTELYRNAILKLEQQKENKKKRWFSGQRKKKFSTEEVETWRHALCEVDGIKGWEAEKYSGDGDLCERVVLQVLDRLKTRQRGLPDDLVGMEVRIEAIDNLLDIENDGVRLIGICGMGGMGKTTLAKIIFNKLCPRFGKRCSFLEDVRETAKTKGLVTLQERLLSEISTLRGARSIFNSDDGIKAIEETICNKKVLIVLDDVDDSEQIQKLIGMKFFSPGTRILITTRNQRTLINKGFKYEIMPYEMEGLSNKDALQLFSRHAFDDISPPANYYTLSEEIVSTAGGLPLALQAIGSSLYHRDIEIWKEMLQKLKNTPNSDVLGKLRISYEALEENQKQIFLDVACFFTGRSKTEPIYMWEASGFSPIYTLVVLIERCMIKVLDNDRFWMHDQFKDLGRTIAKEEPPTRLWERDDISCKLNLPKIKESVQALCLEAELGNPITVTAKQIKRFPNLRILWLSNVTCKGNFTGCLSKLKWIGVHYSHTFYASLEPEHCQGFKATNFPTENLVVMKLSGREFTEEKVISLTEGGKKLKNFTLYRDPPEGNPREFD